jgi:hypothetical protein
MEPPRLTLRPDATALVSNRHAADPGAELGLMAGFWKLLETGDVYPD